MTGAATASRREGSALKLREKAGELRLLSRLLAAPPDAAALADAQTVGLLDAGWQPRLEQIQVEYTRLFSAPGPEAIAAHQSVYTDTLEMEPSPADPTGCGMSFPGGAFQGYLGGKSCAEAARWYREAGFRPSEEFYQMADHISVQLDFLAYLYGAEARALDGDDAEEARAWRGIRDDFRAAFLGRWLEAFAQKAAANEVSDFYARLGRRLSELAAAEI